MRTFEFYSKLIIDAVQLIFANNYHRLLSGKIQLKLLLLFSFSFLSSELICIELYSVNDGSTFLQLSADDALIIDLSDKNMAIFGHPKGSLENHYYSISSVSEKNECIDISMDVEELMMNPCTDCSVIPDRNGPGDCAYPGIGNNQPLNPCDALKITFVIDESGSIQGDEDNVEAGVLAFLNALDCPNAEVAIIEFGATARRVTNYDHIDSVALKMIGYFDGSGYGGVGENYMPATNTNWHDALDEVTQLDMPDLVLFFTDGEPTAYGVDQMRTCRGGVRAPEIYNAMNVANQLKADGVHMFMLGVGGGISEANLAKLSGPIAYENGVNTITNSDYFAEPDFDQLAMCLATFAGQLCPGTTCETILTCSSDNPDVNGSVCVTFDLAGIEPSDVTGFDYQINNGVVVEDVLPQNFPLNNRFCIEDLSSGMYDLAFWVNIDQGPNGICSRPAVGCSILITELECIVSNISTGGCSDSNEGTFDLSVMNGTPGYTYNVVNSDLLTLSVASGSLNKDETITIPSSGGLEYGDYIISVTDSEGCTTTCMVTISSPPELSVTCDKSDVTCNDDSGSSDNGTATATITGSGSGGLNYSWNTTPIQTTATAINLAPGDYTVTVTDINNCTATCSVTLGIADELSITSITSTDVNCNDDEGSSSDGTASVIAMGGTGMYSYQWNDPNDQTTSTATGLLAGTYTVVVTDESGCTATEMIVVNDANPLSVSCSTFEVSCISAGEDMNIGELTPTVVSNGSGGLTYEWNTNPVQTTLTASNLPPGNYMITVTDSNGCIAMCSASVSIPEPLTCSAIQDSEVSCYGGNDGVATASPSGETYLWDNGETTEVATMLTAGMHSVIVTTVDGCTSTCDVMIDGPDEYLFDPVVNCNITMGVLVEVNLGIMGGTSPYEVNVDNEGWRPVMNDTIMVANAGIYMIEIRDNNQCLLSASAEVQCCEIECPSDAEFDCGDLFGIEEWLESYELIGCMGSSVEHDYDVNNFSGGCGMTGSQTITFSVIDAQGVQLDDCQAVLIIIDTIAPMIVCPRDTIIDCNTPIDNITLGTATSMDDCDSSPVITSSDMIEIGDCPQEMVITRRWFAMDACGNVDSCDQMITVQDTMAAMIVCPRDTIIDCNTPIDNMTLGTATSADNCDSSPVITSSDMIEVGDCPQEMVITRRWFATDACGNVDSCDQMITVQDTMAPMIVCPRDTIIDCNTPIDNMTLGTATSTDNCDSSPVITSNDMIEVGSCPQEMVITRRWFAMDACGNVDSCDQMITVQDTMAPMIVSCPADITVNCTAPTDTMSLGGATYTDNCSDNITVTFRDEIEGLDGTCINQVLGTITRTFYGEDECGNIDSSCIQVITVEDVDAPTITFIGDLISGLESGDTIRYQCYGQDENWALPMMGIDDVMALDSCDPDVEVTFEDIVESDGDCATDGYFRRFRCTWTATDECGNSSTAFIYFEIVDTIAPQIFGVPEDIRVSCESIPDTTGVFSTDECLCSHLSLEERLLSNEDCATDEILLRIWTAMDHCGNMTIDTQRIYLIDEVGPAITLTDTNLSGYLDGDIIEFDCADGSYPTWFSELSVISAELIDACSETGTLDFTSKSDSGTCYDDGYLERTVLLWTGKDACGNTSTLRIEGRIVDNEGPVFLNYSDDICTSDPSDIDPIVYDECSSNYFLEYDDFIISRSDCGNEIMRIYTASDVCGNATLDTIMIHSADNTPPQILGMYPLIEAENIRLECHAGEANNISGMSASDVSFEDKCDQDLEINFTEEVIGENPCGSPDGLYVLLLTWTAIDNCGNTTEYEVVAQVFDTESPSANVADTTYYSCGEILPSVYLVDNCGLDYSEVDEDVIAGDCEGETIHIYHLSGIDYCGNEVEKDVVMIIRDDEGPIFDAPKMVCDEDFTLIEEAYDACTNVNVPAQLLEETSTVCDGVIIITRIYSAEDSCGNITLFEQKHYSGEIPELKIEVLDPWLGQILEQGNLVQINTSSVWYSRVSEIDGREIYSPNQCLLAGIDFNKEVELLEDCRADGVREIIRFVWSVRGVCGVGEDIALTFEVKDNDGPVLSMDPADVTVYCGDIPEVPNVTAIDNYNGQLVVDYSKHTTITENGSIITREWIFEDRCGNQTTVDQVVTMIDDTGLSCEIIPENQSIPCNSRNNLITGQAIGSSGPYTYSWSVTEGDCLITSGQGTPNILVYVGFLDINLELTVTDIYGCKSTCSYNVNCDEKPSKFGVDDQTYTHSLEDSGVNSERIINTWPNPVRDYLSLRIESNQTSVGDIEIFDALGRKIYEQTVETNKEVKLQSDWPQGLYILRYKEDGIERIKHFIKSETIYQSNLK